MILVYDILHGRVNLLIEGFFETPVNSNLHGHRFKLRHQMSHLARRKFTFSVRIFEPRDKLPPEVVDSASEEIFKFRHDGVTPFTTYPSLNMSHDFLIFRFF